MEQPNTEQRTTQRLTNIEVIELGNWLEKQVTDNALPDELTDLHVAAYATDKLGFNVTGGHIRTLRTAKPERYNWHPEPALTELEQLQQQNAAMRAALDQVEENQREIAQAIVDLAETCNLSLSEHLHVLAGDRDEHQPQLALAGKEGVAA